MHPPTRHRKRSRFLEYRFIDLASTQTILARIKGIPRTGGGGQLAFETNAGTAATTQRMLIDSNGNVGIGSENPGARLEVAGDVKLNGPLSVQGAVTANGAARVAGDLDVAGEGKFGGPLNVQGAFMTGGAATIGGDLSVTGKLTAASFKGNGAGLSNVTPRDGSITNAKLAQDAASLSKVSGGKMKVSGDNIAVSGTVSFADIRTKTLGIGVSEVYTNSILVVGSRMRVRNDIASEGSAGIWYMQGSEDRAFIGMLDDNTVGFYCPGGLGWGFWMRKTDGFVQIVGDLYARSISTGQKAFKIDHPLDLLTST